MSGHATVKIDYTGRAFEATIGYNNVSLPIRVTIGSHDGSKESAKMSARDVTPFVTTQKDGRNSVLAPAATQIAMVVVVEGEDARYLDATHIAVSMHANTATTNPAAVQMLYCKLNKHADTTIVLASIVGGESFGVAALGANAHHDDIAKHANLDSGTWTMNFLLAKEKEVEAPVMRGGGTTRSGGATRGIGGPVMRGGGPVMRGGDPAHSQFPCTPGDKYLEGGYMSVAFNAGQDNSVYGKATFTKLMNAVSVAFAVRVGWNDALDADIVTHSSGQNAALPTENDLAELAMIGAARKHKTSAPAVICKPLELENGN